MIKVYSKWDEQFVACDESEKMEEILENICGILAHRGKWHGGRTCENTLGQLGKCNTSFYVSRTILYLAISSCSNAKIAQWYANKKSMVDLQKRNNSPYKNAEQERTKLLIKPYNLYETTDFPYQMYYIYR